MGVKTMYDCNFGGGEEQVRPVGNLICAAMGSSGGYRNKGQGRWRKTLTLNKRDEGLA